MTAPRRRLFAAVLVVAVVGAGVVGTAATASAESNFVLVHTDATPERPTTDANFTVSTDVSNAADSDGRYAVKRVTVFEGDDADERDRLNRTEPRVWVSPGKTATANVSVGFDERGTRELLVRIRLVSPADGVRIVERTLTVDVRRPHPLVGVSFEPTVAGSATNATVRVVNGLDAPIRNVELRLEPTDATFRARSHAFAVVESGSESNVSVGVTGETNGTETVSATLSYDYNGTRYTATQTLTETFARPANPGRVTLTNLRIEPAEGGDSLRVRGTASNPGGSDVTGVTVSVLDGDGAVPANDNSDFFVGRVAASDFGAFEARATPTRNGTVTVPLRVSYRVDGARRETVRRVRYKPPDEETETESTDGPPLELLGGAAVLVVGVGAAVWRVRRGR